MIRRVNDMSVMAIDLETKNYSYEIGGWDNTHMFRVSTVCTWDGDKGTIYIDKAVDNLKKSNVEVKTISQLKFDLDDHFEKGGKLLGHNIVAFDLPVLKNALDIYCIKKYLDAEAYIDTSQILNKEYGERYSLSNLVQHTLGTDKLMTSEDAPVVWKAGGYSEVAEYCLKDCELVYDLWKHGQSHNIVKGFSLKGEEIKNLEVEW
jgi:DEAD/DEAH box helicase domain-containing protein